MKITVRYHSEKEQDLLAIEEANYIGDFAIRLKFSNGHMTLVDFKPFLEVSTHPAIKKYLNEELFKNFQITDGNIDWDDFDLCFPIEDLYKNRILKKESSITKA
ncbi:MAG TPA: DUF2442 domain-containing protein [Algoriphagus sp.]|nr:DUF2442 domain-containing protein [Algoriphagus sp.]